MEPEQHSPKISGTRDVFFDFSEATVEVSGPKGSAFCDEEDAFNKMINKAVRVTYENLVKLLYETPRIIIVRTNEEFDEDAIKNDYTYIRPRRMMADIASQPGGLLVDYKNQSQAALYAGVRSEGAEKYSEFLHANFDDITPGAQALGQNLCSYLGREFSRLLQGDFQRAVRKAHYEIRKYHQETTQ